ncbi:DegQ family serine endoprotease [Bermanella marisrubri]|uniref:Probable periplasmic serine endoprotease DegP-like n=1 Tax=Bermanella marisrubri TaxID=207949 RepID=Q1N1B9_9GAMM|nr:DegQ family serine endoprotease [Bermanella marisrubri]EAT12131.1 alginate biosynthesis negative regulator, serine protease AlgY [Oceanobacter sp. RED65] [Bermanella marisrubri]QIZ83594.1 DegQ family serine endoprotease [Bermanella marisrubri]
MKWLMTLVLLLMATQAWSKLPDFTELVQESSPAVVNISTTQKASNRYHQFDLPQGVPDIFRHFFGVPPQAPRGNPAPRSQQERSSLGSGFIVSEDGYVLTNNHVIDGADQIFVRLNDRRELEAKLIGSDPSSDLALLKVDADNLPTVEIGDSENLKVGEWVVAIGSPFGFDYSVTAGIVSAKGRSLPNENYVPFIQTDVAINPGNSGGPLFNLDGEVVGINSQIYTRSGGFMGLSFAIPMNVAMEVVDQLKETGTVTRGWLGVAIQEVDKELAESFGLDKAAGALVSQVVENGPADAAGVKYGDIITEFNGKKVTLSSDLPHLVGRVRPGTKAKLRIIRHGKAKTLNVEIGALPNGGDVIASNSNMPQQSKSNRLGIEVVELTQEQRKKWDATGVMVKSVKQGPGANAGLINGDVITMIYGEIIRDMSDFNRIAEQLPAGRSVPMRIVRRGAPMFIPLRINQ